MFRKIPFHFLNAHLNSLKLRAHRSPQIGARVGWACYNPPPPILGPCPIFIIPPPSSLALLHPFTFISFFSLNVLSKDNLHLITSFSGRECYPLTRSNSTNERGPGRHQPMSGGILYSAEERSGKGPKD